MDIKTTQHENDGLKENRFDEKTMCLSSPRGENKGEENEIEKQIKNKFKRKYES